MEHHEENEEHVWAEDRRTMRNGDTGEATQNA